MADTGDLQQAIGWVRAHLATEHGTPFEKRAVPLVTGGSRTFNAVATSGQVVATITNHSALTSGGKKPVGKVRSAVADLYFLALADAPERKLVVTNGEFFQLLIHDLEGAVAPGLQIVHVALPPEIAALVAGMRDRASDEMTR